MDKIKFITIEGLTTFLNLLKNSFTTNNLSVTGNTTLGSNDGSDTLDVKSKIISDLILWNNGNSGNWSETPKLKFQRGVELNDNAIDYEMFTNSNQEFKFNCKYNHTNSGTGVAHNIATIKPIYKTESGKESELDYAFVNASNCKATFGNLIVNNNTTLGNDVNTDTVTINAKVNTIIPNENGTKNLGSADYAWNALYAKNMLYRGITANTNKNHYSVCTYITQAKDTSTSPQIYKEAQTQTSVPGLTNIGHNYDLLKLPSTLSAYRLSNNIKYKSGTAGETEQSNICNAWNSNNAANSMVLHVSEQSSDTFFQLGGSWNMNELWFRASNDASNDLTKRPWKKVSMVPRVSAWPDPDPSSGKYILSPGIMYKTSGNKTCHSFTAPTSNIMETYSIFVTDGTITFSGVSIMWANGIQPPTSTAGNYEIIINGINDGSTTTYTGTWVRYY